MPVCPVYKELLCSQLKDIETEDDIERLCFDFGTEYDGEVICEKKGTPMWRIEVAANRYDLLSPEGIIKAFRVFQGLDDIPKFTINPPKETLIVDKEAARVRPFCVAAVVRDLNLTEETYQSFIDLQDKLHQNICAKRRLVSVGTHDLDTIQGPFKFTAKAPTDFKFKPLNQECVVDGAGMMDLYAEHSQLKAYLPLIKESRVYPLIIDVNDTICSVPPIINGDHSKMSKDTKNVFIEVTALDKTKARIVLHVLIASLTEHTKVPYTVEQVNVQYESDWESGLEQGTRHTGVCFQKYTSTGDDVVNGQTIITPDMEEDLFYKVPMDYLTSLIGIPKAEMDEKKMCELLHKMMLKATPGTGCVDVAIPITRSDVLHHCDIAEDAGIAYGFNNLPFAELPAAKERPMGGLDHQIRQWMSQAGFNEIYNWALCQRKDGFENMGFDMANAKAVKGTEAEAKIEFDPYVMPIELGNSKSSEFEIVRPSLLGCMLKCLAHNTGARQPIQMFEVGSCGAQAEDQTIQGLNRNHFGAVFASNASAGFEKIHGVVDYILMKLQMTPSYIDSMGLNDNQRVKNGIYYRLEERTNDPAFMSNRSVNIVAYNPCGGLLEEGGLKERVIGRFGILKPSVISPYGLTLPVSALEITLEPFMNWLSEVDCLDE